MPEILTSEEVRDLLQKAKEQNHPWYPIWIMAILTGCRSGELHQLRRSDLELVPQEKAKLEDEKAFDKKKLT